VVTKEAFGGTTATDVVFKGVRELFLGLHAVDIYNEGRGAAEELGHGGTAIDGGGIGVNGVCGKVFVTTWGVDGWIGRFEPLLEDAPHGDPCHLSGGLEGTLDGVSALPEEVRAEGSVVLRIVLDIAACDGILEHVDGPEWCDV
jgi:hypothetical protein